MTRLLHLLAFKKMAYEQSYGPKHQEVAIFCCFSLIHI